MDKYTPVAEVAGLYVRGKSWFFDRQVNKKRCRRVIGRIGEVSKAEAISIARMMGKAHMRESAPAPRYFTEQLILEPHKPISRRVRDRLEARLAKYKSNALARGISFDLTIEELRALFVRANGRCEVTGVEFSGEAYNARARPFAPSLDRINTKAGYAMDNCRVVCASVNIALNDFGEHVLRRIAFAYVEKFLREESTRLVAYASPAEEVDTKEISVSI
jgi:hypothetical protein